ncbi:MAG TPA: tetratricopeptide repeat protein [Pyrinomonadaceae bacterium]|nr:tetratricopeptide repeat protein [Pyrinomonadaceae bacterium]
MKRRGFVSGLIAFFTLSLTITAGTQTSSSAQEALPKGQVIDKVTCVKNPEQSYALYLPSNYDRARKWPVIYAFDPGARGKMPVSQFKDAAEKFGWIVVGSNNSRNGSAQSPVDAWNAITVDVAERFSIDGRRAYATGFSGGARIALFFAARCNDCLAGVIASGAGFPNSISPDASMHFSIFAAAAYDDFNFSEVRSLEEPLTKAKIAHRVETFDGRHEWLPSAVAIEAVEWMEIQAMKSGRRARDDEFIKTAWQNGLQKARAFDAAKKPYEAFQAYRSLVETYSGLHNVNEAEQKLNEYKASREVKEAIRDEQQQFNKQRDLEKQFWSLVAERDRNNREESRDSFAQNNSQDSRDSGLDASVRLSGLLSNLRKDSEGTDDTGKRRIARRVLSGLFVALFERGTDLLEARKLYAEAIKTFRLVTEVNPERAGGYYYLAWAYAANGDKKRALENLRTAVNKGFSDSAAINDNKAFGAIAADPQYQSILQAIRDKR